MSYRTESGAVNTFYSNALGAKTLQCDMDHFCRGEVTHLEEKGWVYCSRHGAERKQGGRRVRKLRQHEINRLKRGQQIERY